MIKPKWRQNRSIRRNIIVLFFLLIFAPFVFFAYFSFTKSAEGITNANDAFSLDYLIQSERNLDDYLKQINIKLNDLIGSNTLQELMRQTREAQEDENVFISGITNLIAENKPYIGALGIRIYPINPTLYPEYMDYMNYGVDVSKQAWFLNEKQSGQPTWQLFLPKDNNTLYPEPVISLIKQFTSLYESKPIGIIVVDLSEELIQRFMAPPQKLQGQESFLLDVNGIIISHPKREMIGQKVTSEELPQIINKNNQGTATILVDHTKSFITYVKLKEAPWTLVSSTPFDLMMKPVRDIGNLTLFFLATYIVCFIGILVYISLYFTNPIIRLVHFMQRIEIGSFQLGLPKLQRRDEIGLLYLEFDRMTIKIRELIDEVYLSEKAKKELSFQVLSHQINPHFLYNTLESIRWRAEQYHMKDISEMVASLGKLLRLSLNQGKELTTVSREVEQVKAYIHIEKMKFDKPLRILFYLDDDIQDFPFLRLLLQPLVENAIHHGIRNMPDNGKIIVSGRKDGDNLHFELYDNGTGIPKHIIEALMNGEAIFKADVTSSGVGLFNVNSRLKLYFGEEYGLSIEALPGKGTRIIIKHPILPANFDGFR